MRLALTAALLAVSAASCRDPDPSCDFTGTWPTSLRLEGCSDQRHREVKCSRTDPTEDWTCSCHVGGSLGRSFVWPAAAQTEPAADRRRLAELLGRHCRWDLSSH